MNETIEVLEIDELYTFYKKKNQIRVCLAVNRNKLQIAASEVEDGSGATVEKLLKKLSSCNIKIMCTDGNYAYNKHINIKHVITKAETCLVETYNSILRHSLA